MLQVQVITRKEETRQSVPERDHTIAHIKVTFTLEVLVIQRNVKYHYLKNCPEGCRVQEVDQNVLGWHQHVVIFVRQVHVLLAEELTRH